MNLTVDLKERSYGITIGKDLLANAGKYFDLGRNVLIVTDDNIPTEYSEKIKKCSKNGIIKVVPNGEKSKSFDGLETLLKTMLDNGFSRKDCVVAVGGGVVGDLSGFAAACYMRGIDFYNIPTTLLSQIDSSVGGKTAVDFNGVKNAIGAFYQPKKVVIDPTVLKTLDSRQLHAGLAEAIKMAATSDEKLFELLEKSSDLQKDLPQIIERALLIKKKVVEKDPEENGLRKVLNFGHTIGHAIESANDGRLLHGECVALGMIPMCGKEAKERILAVLKKYDLPTENECSAEELLPFVKHDKKSEAGTVAAVYVPEIGTFEFKKVVPEDLFKKEN